ncbi:DUF4179 domain-containing protein [Brevibacillus borstelensis]|uniref:DUF4179 domain-containing protein n=1 Tax=Brevibacillus borstelensis TaxID=45462 RepID=UPI0030BFA5D6
MSRREETDGILPEKEAESRPIEDLIKEQLTEKKEQYEKILSPPEADAYILAGMSQAKGQLRKQKRQGRIRWSLLAACSLVVGLFFTIRLSPAVAAYVSHIPGMEPLVKMIQAKKGLEMAANHGLAQEIGAFAEAENVSFTIDQVIGDQRRMLLLYTIQHKEPGHVVQLESIDIQDDKGNKIPLSYSLPRGSFEPASHAQEAIEVYPTDENPALPDNLVVKATIFVDAVPMDTPLTVTVPIDKSKYADLKEKIYPVNQTVTVDGQKLTISQVAVYPTQAEVTIRFAPENTKKIFGFDNLRLEDEKGQTFAFWGNGVPSHNNGEHEVIYHLKSNYFDTPRQLYLKASGIQALDKDKLLVVIDAKNKVLLKAPDDRLSLEALRQNEDVVGMDYHLRVDEQDSHNFGPHISELTDDLGNRYESVQGTSVSGKPETIQRYGALFKRTATVKEGIPSTYQFTLSHYPTRLKGELSLPIEVK